MDINNALACISKIKISNIQETGHFIIRYNQRKNQILLSIDDIKKTIITEKPVTIIKQNLQKFKLVYELGNNLDLAIIISINTHQSLTMKLVTLFIEQSEKRRH